MTLSFLVLGLSILGIVAMEWTLWKLLRRNIEGMLLPHNTDASSLQFFTLQRLRACAVAHTIFLIVCVCILSSFLW